jgi:serralysin
MPKPDHHYQRAGNKQHAIDHVTSNFIGRGGLSFDFDAGSVPYDYQVAIGSGRSDTLVGGAPRDHFWGLAGDERI